MPGLFTNSGAFAIRENQSTNRRVLIRVYPMSLDDREERQKKIEIVDLISQGKESSTTARRGKRRSRSWT